MEKTLEILTTKLCESLPLDLTIHEKETYCTKPTPDCNYCKKHTNNAYLCYKKTYTLDQTPQHI